MQARASIHSGGLVTHRLCDLCFRGGLHAYLGYTN